MMYDKLINKLYHCANEVFCNKCSYSPDCAGEKAIIRDAADAIECLSHAVDQMTEWRKERKNDYEKKNDSVRRT